MLYFNFNLFYFILFYFIIYNVLFIYFLFFILPKLNNIMTLLLLYVMTLLLLYVIIVCHCISLDATTSSIAFFCSAVFLIVTVALYCLSCEHVRSYSLCVGPNGRTYKNNGPQTPTLSAQRTRTHTHTQIRATPYPEYYHTLLDATYCTPH